MVFVVEDEESFIEALDIGLKREGFRVTVAKDGAEALAMFDKINPDIILLDVMLPKVSGTDVCREIRKKESSAYHHGFGKRVRDRHDYWP